MSANDGRPAKIEFKGDVDVNAFNQLNVTLGRVEASLKKTARAGEDAAKKIKPPVKEAQDFNASLMDGVKNIAAQVAGFEAVRRAILAVIEAQERAAQKQLAATDRMAQLSARAGSLQPGEDRSRIEAFSRRTGFTSTQSVEIFERGQSANPAMPWSQNRNRSAALGEIADTLQVQDAAGFVEMGQRLMKGNANLTERGAAARALAMQQSGVTDVGGFAEQFGANTDVAVAAAQAAKDAGQDPAFVAALLGKVASLQSKGRKEAGRDGAFAFGPGGAAIDPAELLRTGGIPESFLASEMTRGNKGASAKAFLAAMPGRLAGIDGLESAMGASERAMGSDRSIRMKEAAEAAKAAAEWNEINRGGGATGQSEVNRMKIEADLQRTAIGGALAQVGAARYFNAQDNILVGATGVLGTDRWGAGANPPPAPSVRTTAPPGVSIDVRVSQTGEQPTAGAL